MIGKRGAAVATAAVLVSLAAPAHAQKVPWRPFTSVNTVCDDDCDDGRYDQIFLQNGDRISAWILLENPTFYVVTLHDEVRAVDKSRVARVERASGERPSLEGHVDQVVLDSGHVLSGRIVADTELPPYLQVKSANGRFTYTAHKPQVLVVVRSGQEVPVPREAPAPR